MPQTRITDDNLAPLVDILTWFLLVTSITGVTVRGATKAAIIHIVGLDDALITIALVSILRTTRFLETRPYRVCKAVQHWSVQCGCGTDCEWLWEADHLACFVRGPYGSKGEHSVLAYHAQVINIVCRLSTPPVFSTSLVFAFRSCPCWL